jgi:hypothetical protein
MTTIPAQGEPGDWPAHGPDPEEVRTWISASLPGRPTVAGPTVIHRAHAWGLTARYRVSGPEPHEVVFKASFLPPEFGVAEPYRLLHRSGATGLHPELLAWIDVPGRRWLLFRAFQGTSAGDLPGIDPLVAVATSMARVQALVAAVPAPTASGLLGPVISIREIPAMLDRLVGIVRRDNPPPTAADTAGRLEAGRNHLLAWVRELDQDGWPASIHHVDLHPHNAVIRAGGSALIYDWEEASLGFPFFTLDKLLLAAAGRAPDGTAAVRAAYLDALPWKSRTERERAFDLAMRLSPIRFADADARFAHALGWSERDAIAPWIPIALQRWEEPD